MGKYLVRMIKREWRGHTYGQNIKKYNFEYEIKDDTNANDVLYHLSKKDHPNLEYCGYSPVKDTLPDGWKRTEGTLTAPNGYYWADNNKSLFSGDREVALIKE